MNVNLKQGVDRLVFGMMKRDVISLYGNPDKQFEDEEANVIWLYNNLNLRLTFYADENFRFGYIISTNPEIKILNLPVIGVDVEKLKSELSLKGLKIWEKEDYDMAENHFNEDNWLILQSEFGKVVKLELGAIIGNDDEFDWKFK